MPKKAQENQGQGGGIEWAEVDLCDWQPERKYEVIFSNAELQWLDPVDELLHNV